MEVKDEFGITVHAIVTAQDIHEYLQTKPEYENVLKLMEEYPDYKFMSSQPQLYQFLKERYPELLAQIKERVSQGRWEPEGGMWVEADCNLTSGESLVRQLMVGKKFFRDEFGVESRSLFLPDVFGYAVIYAALSKLSALNESFELAQKGFFRAMCVDVAKLVAIVFIMASQNPNEKNTLLLLASFAFAVVELIILIPAFRNLFEGFMNLGYKYENNSVLSYSKESSRKNRTEKIRSFTVFFLIVKAAMSTLPEFAVLSTQNYDNTSHTLDIYNFIGLLRFFAISCALVVGVIWLVRIVAYFRRVVNDSEFSGALLRDYELNVLPRKSLFVRKTVKLLSLLFCMAAIFCIDLRVGSFNVLFDTLAAITLIVSVFASRKHLGKMYKCLIPFVVYAVISVVALVFEFSFYGEYYYSAIWRDDKAYASYVIMLVFSVLDAAAFLFAVGGMASMLRKIVNEHTGFYVPNASINVEDKIKRVRGALNKRIYLLCAVAVLAAAGDLFYDFVSHSAKYALLLNTVTSVIFFVTVFFVTDAIGEEVESKYMLD